jgi:hypothetical protein
MTKVLLTSFGPIRKGDWTVKVSHLIDQVLVVAYHKTKYEGHIRCFTNEYEAVLYVEYLLLKGDFSTDSTE